MRRHPAMAAAVVVAGLAAAALLFLLLFDFKEVFERRASASLGRPVTVAALHINIFPLRLILTDLDVADTPSAPMMHAKTIDATLAFWPLLAGRFVFSQLAVDDATAVVTRDANGNLNWATPRRAQEEQKQAQASKVEDQSARQAQKAQKKPELVEIRDLSLHDTKFRYRDAITETDLTLNLETLDKPEGGERQLKINGQGIYVGARTTVSALAGSILALRDATTPYPVDGKITSGDTTITVKGTVTDPVHMAGLDVALSVKGADASDLYRLVGIALPATPPYEIKTRLDHDQARWIFKSMIWNMGETDLAGEMVWDLSGAVPNLTGKLHAQTLNLDDMAGFIGAAPGKAKTPDEVKAAAAEREKARRAQNAPPPPIDKPKDKKMASKDSTPEKGTVTADKVADKLVIPDTPMNFEKINSMNADVALSANHVINAGFPLDNLAVNIKLQDGILKLAPLTLGVDAGRISLDLTVNAVKPPVHTDALVKVTNYPLQRLISKTDSENNNTSFGAIGGHIELHGNGDSMHRLLDDADGSMALIARGGQISDLVIQVVGLNVANIVGLLLTKDKPVPIRCMVTNFEVEKGTMAAKAVVLDTEKSIITGTGTVDLGAERLNLKLHPKPKKVGIGSLRVPFQFTGTFADPSIGPDPEALALRGGIVGALSALLTPLAGLLATIEGGGGKDADCEALFQDAK